MSAIGFPHHEISIVVDGVQVKGWETYEITTSMLEPANHFSLRMPFGPDGRDVWDLCKTDRKIKILIDNVVVMKGFIDERSVPEDDESVDLVGRSMVGRMVQESAPGIDFAGSNIFELVKKVAKPWFGDRVQFSNAVNRTVTRGKGKKAKAYDRAATLTAKKNVGTHIQPGMTEWQVVDTLLAQAGYLAWETSDGETLIVGEPNYEQENQFRFFMPASGSRRSSESTVQGMGVHESVADRYARIIVVGAGQGTTDNYGAAVSSRYAEAKNNPADPEGVGIDFTAPKRLVMQRAVNSMEEAQELADREKARRDMSRQTITVRAPGHGQVIAGTRVTLFTYDLMTAVEDERTGTKGSFYITGCTYRSHRKDGEETLMHIIPKGTRLVV